MPPAATPPPAAVEGRPAGAEGSPASAGGRQRAPAVEGPGAAGAPFARLAVVGATGAVGREALRVLEARGVGPPGTEVVALASARSAGARLPFAGGELEARALEGFDFAGTDAALFSAGASVSGAHAPRAAAAGALVVDNSSRFRLEPDVPLVVPEANARALAAPPPRGIVANPNCVVIQVAVAIAPLAALAAPRRLVLDALQAASGAGAAALAELEAQERDGAAAPEPERLPRRLARDLVPQVGPFDADGESEEEAKLRLETRRVLSAPGLAVQATCVRAPVPVGHAVCAHLESAAELRLEDAAAALEAAPGVSLRAAPGAYATPGEAAGQDDVIVSRLRRDRSVPFGLSMWIAADNLRKGAALNAVQILEAARDAPWRRPAALSAP